MVVVPRNTLYAAELSRPDLAVPLAPGSRWARRVVGLNEPRFTEVSQRIRLLVVLSAVGALAGELLVTSTTRPLVLAFAAGLAAYAGVSWASLATLRRQQVRFEPAWLAAQSDVLREQRFEVLRFTTSEPVRTTDGRRALRRVYDLTRPDDVERLLALRGRSHRVRMPVTVEFSYRAGDTIGVEQVRAELGSLHLVFRPGTGTIARVWFPEARYGIQPSAGRPTTYWVLGEPSLTVTQRSLDRVTVP